MCQGYLNDISVPGTLRKDTDMKRRRLGARPLSELSGGRLIERILREASSASIFLREALFPIRGARNSVVRPSVRPSCGK